MHSGHSTVSCSRFHLFFITYLLPCLSRRRRWTITGPRWDVNIAHTPAFSDSVMMEQTGRWEGEGKEEEVWLDLSFRDKIRATSTSYKHGQLWKNWFRALLLQLSIDREMRCFPCTIFVFPSSKYLAPSPLIRVILCLPRLPRLPCLYFFICSASASSQQTWYQHLKIRKHFSAPPWYQDAGTSTLPNSSLTCWRRSSPFESIPFLHNSSKDLESC